MRLPPPLASVYGTLPPTLVAAVEVGRLLMALPSLS
jgi:hypothetical protein